MGVAGSKCYNKHFVEPRELRARICVLEEEMKEIRREKELKEQVFALERKKQKEEVARLRKRVEEEEQRVRRLEDEANSKVPASIGVAFGGNDRERRRLEMDSIVHHMREEQARREAAIHKWKQLYLAIKTELDELILRTKEGDRFCWASEQALVVERLQRELKAKEEALETLRAKLAAMEREGTRKEREIDILRQSLKILNNSQRSRGRRYIKRMLNNI